MIDTEQQLNRLRSEIEYHRKKAESLRKRAEGQDRIADDKVKLAAELGTLDLPLLDGISPEAKKQWDEAPPEMKQL